MNTFYRLLPLLLVGLAGCATPKDEQVVPFTQEQVKSLFARARPPQAFGLTVYSSEVGPFFAGASRVHQGDVARLSFQGARDSTAPLVALAGRGIKGLPALIDTTSKDNWINAVAGQQLGIVMLVGPAPYQMQAQHVYDEIGGAAGLVQKVMLDESHVENVVFFMQAASGPLGSTARWVENPAPVLTLGNALLRGFSFVQLNYPERSAVFASTARFPPPDASTLLAKLPMKDVMRAIAVDGTLDGDPVSILIDTAGDYDLVLNEPPDTTMRRLSIGDLVFPPEVNVVSSMDQGLGPTVYPRIGRRLLSRFKVTFDFRNKQIYFERPVPLEKTTEMGIP